jgi:hypothetical protein
LVLAGCQGVVGPFQGSKARNVLVDQRWLTEHDME